MLVMLVLAMVNIGVVDVDHDNVDGGARYVGQGQSADMERHALSPFIQETPGHAAAA